jgi:hypothetical protein
MLPLKVLTRDEIAAELRAPWDECEKAYPDFRNSWATLATSPILFRYGELLWRTTQCAAFNWHNELLELELEPEVRPWTSS